MCDSATVNWRLLCQLQLCSDPWGSRGSQEGRMGPTARAPRLLGQIISSVAVSSFASSLIANLGFQKGNDKEALEIGAETLKQTALYFHQQRQDSNCMMLPC
ncbi:hypothetical protein PVAP13_3NG140722 [Panicum virgatum]|uniref:Uncharacterized protein n=1 Tax=Panicum virgatum TaxID=38727 RepID=A0A8T0UET8_PANVG|nr:hypothetical protein PVAP13_3NG140722 [Panicum virgatum]